MTLSEEIRKMSLVRVASLGLEPEVLLALTSTDEQRARRAAEARELVAAGQPLTPAIIKQLAADAAVAAQDRVEARQELLALTATRQKLLNILATRAR